jgi:hypothetical protein
MAYIGLVRCGNIVPDNTIIEIPASTFVLNSDEVNADGVSSGTAQIVINRGPNLPAAILRFNEQNDKFEIGFANNEFRELENSLWKFIDTDTLLEKNTNYFVDVSQLTSINLVLPPNPNIGDTMILSDVAGKFCERNIYLRRNDKKIMGTVDDVKLEGLPSFRLVYSNDTYGWRFV